MFERGQLLIDEMVNHDVSKQNDLEEKYYLRSHISISDTSL